MDEIRQTPTPGEVLAEARTKRGLSLDQVAERTKIPTPILAAIEQDEYHRLSGPLYVRSFLRTYAGEVGLDPQPILDLYGGGPATASGETPQAKEQVWQDAEVKVERIGLPWPKILGAALGILLAAAIVIVLAVKGGRERQEPPADSRAAAAAPADAG